MLPAGNSWLCCQLFLSIDSSIVEVTCTELAIVNSIQGIMLPETSLYYHDARA